MKSWQWGNAAELSTDGAQLAAQLAPLGVRLRAYPVASAAAPWLAPAQLDASEQERLLSALDGVFQELQRERGYQDRDLVILYPEHPLLAELDAKFCRIHIHEDEEVRYIVDGEGVFGFVLPDGRQLEVTISAGDYIDIPAGVEHWFRLNGLQRIKAVRYFSARGGWVPVYQERSMQEFPRP
ncbi:cupin domain-containing protein [Acidithiobacillus sp. CV18-2]|uniref:Acireductone dioxygenase n=1 Tax=Igneacidithiobacillus copahuensis TaxID=2724909 RepID=A0AAE3CIZ5_9PROT|nr:cupin domain-containing protein [Igneacidithiobacillus copahuensis]MBU2753919.1 cupin domain-containing protein [Acidithiobacillus sp. CV18-3]MBU2756147.1 cupin domain-containing protein [Acidithiobacillus sp. BN09-2]MBU2778592.1 cupin domain-containing protein [Acidithiobacillus sp. CV18-2]MBU2797159.1 cupin domain-containing protein [Acidithiobacillus sp. VAN18-2]MBU2798952.1 cupin domain-containing protein [Acidithiobacillus sp. VAN18-4]UTV81492.1 cupin domain-containing protein [Acidit